MKIMGHQVWSGSQDLGSWLYISSQGSFFPHPWRSNRGPLFSRKEEVRVTWEEFVSWGPGNVLNALQRWLLSGLTTSPWCKCGPISPIFQMGTLRQGRLNNTRLTNGEADQNPGGLALASSHLITLPHSFPQHVHCGASDHVQVDDVFPPAVRSESARGWSCWSVWAELTVSLQLSLQPPWHLSIHWALAHALSVP